MLTTQTARRRIASRWPSDVEAPQDATIVRALSNELQGRRDEAIEAHSSLVEALAEESPPSSRSGSGSPYRSRQSSFLWCSSQDWHRIEEPRFELGGR